MASLKVSIVSNIRAVASLGELVDVFVDLISYITARDSRFDLQTVQVEDVSYESSSYPLSKNCIASLTPSKYLSVRDELQGAIVPILSVKKVGQAEPYFPAYFVVSSDSIIDSIHSEHIRTLYLVSSNSTSGYVAPLYKLWEAGVIDSPNEHGVRNKGWELILVGSQDAVDDEVANDRFSIGATGLSHNLIPTEGMGTKSILRYYSLPQDVLVISQNLLPYKPHIISWFEQKYAAHDSNIARQDVDFPLARSPFHITGVEPITLSYENALRDLEKMLSKVRSDGTEQTNGLTRYKIFVASSSELRADRDYFELFISRANSDYVQQGFYFEVVRWENFFDAMSQDGLQEEYNKAVARCDIFVSLFFTKAGRFTQEEFKRAFGSFQEHSRPMIFTYFKNAPVLIEEIGDEILSLLEFREAVKSLGHYRTVYTDSDNLENQFLRQLKHFLELQMR